MQKLEKELARLGARVKRTKQMVQDGIKDYAEGCDDIRSDQAQMRQIQQELVAVGRVVSLPPQHAVETYVRRITAKEPKEFAGRRDILERILDLRMTYLDKELRIEGLRAGADCRGEFRPKEVYSSGMRSSLPIRVSSTWSWMRQPCRKRRKP
jgi:hypothetical protein